jgi:hypothetical protein
LKENNKNKNTNNVHNKSISKKNNQQNAVSTELIKVMYQEDLQITINDGQKFEIPPEGNLGLLAIGYKGLIAVRKKRIETDWKNENEIISDKKTD